MHPAYRSNRPGVAPDCGMQLEAVYAPVARDHSSAFSPDNICTRVQVSAQKQQIIGVKIGYPEVSTGPHTVRTVGRVAYDDTRVYRLNAATQGWMQEVRSRSIGSFVRKGEVLATYYTRDLRSAVQAYLYVDERLRSGSAESRPGDNGLDERGLDLAIENLRNLGMSDEAIQELRQKRVAPQYVSLRSPVAGFITAKNASPLRRFERGDELYSIVDLTRVWIVADVFERDMRLIQGATAAKITLKHSEQALPATVTETLPMLDNVSRTLQLRLEADNPGFVLKPDMFVDVEFPARLPEGITVPASAVLNSGRTNRVFVSVGNEYFEPKIVETGWRFKDRIQIVSGLSARDEIVVSGNFLLDSEIRMKTPEK
jgi:Cu(I)/Ag(I) efflux system membrane fusion protein